MILRWRFRKIYGSYWESSWNNFPESHPTAMFNFNSIKATYAMHKTLIIKAFEKAEYLRIKQGEKKPSLTNRAEDLSEYIFETEGFVLGERSYRDYFVDAKRLIDTNQDISIKQVKVIKGLSKYLGFDNYEAFVVSLSPKNNRKRLFTFLRAYKTILIICLLFLSTSIILFFVNRQRWMIWQEDHYVEVSFNVEAYKLGQLKLYNADSIQYFKKINPDCNTDFFNADGHVNVWYGKNEDNAYDYFTDLELHPETGKTLNPITPYIIRTYICKDY